MKKIRKLSLFGILGVVITVLFLISISITQAEPEDTWAVRIPTLDSGDLGIFYGVGDGYYENNDPNITVSVEKNSPGAWRKYFNFVYAFDFTITNENFGSGTPPDNQVGFQSVGSLEIIEGEPAVQFPGGSILAFLNNEHPYSGVETGEEDYQYFWCRVNVFDYDIESMTEGETYVFGGNPDTDRDASEPGDYLSMVARYQQECYPEPLYHDVELSRNINWARAVENGNPHNIEIERLNPAEYANLNGIECEAVWRFWVSDTGYYGLPGGYLKVKERYCTIEKNKIKWYYPMEAKGTFNFYIDWIKNPNSSTQPEDPPEAPSNLSALAPACDQIDLSWNDNSDNESGFKIERDDSFLTTVNANETSYSDTGLDPGTTYSYRVRAFNDAGDSGYSNTASATTTSCGTEPPAPPSDLTANAIGKAKIALNWTDNSNNEDGFIIYRSFNGDYLTQYDTVGPNTSSYVDNQVSSKTTYNYQVCAYKENVESCSSTASATIK